MRVSGRYYIAERYHIADIKLASKDFGLMCEEEKTEITVKTTCRRNLAATLFVRKKVLMKGRPRPSASYGRPSNDELKDSQHGGSLNSSLTLSNYNVVSKRKKGTGNAGRKVCNPIGQFLKRLF